MGICSSGMQLDCRRHTQRWSRSWKMSRRWRERRSWCRWPRCRCILVGSEGILLGWVCIHWHIQCISPSYSGKHSRHSWHPWAHSFLGRDSIQYCTWCRHRQSMIGFGSWQYSASKPRLSRPILICRPGRSLGQHSWCSWWCSSDISMSLRRWKIHRYSSCMPH